jgi:hypothetical protein
VAGALQPELRDQTRPARSWTGRGPGPTGTAAA